MRGIGLDLRFEVVFVCPRLVDHCHFVGERGVDVPHHSKQAFLLLALCAGHASLHLLGTFGSELFLLS